jgi:hypothetical protein
VFEQHPKLKLKNMDGGELITGAMILCLKTIMRSLWRTASKSHFSVCKVWSITSFNEVFFFCFFLFLFLVKDSWNSREGVIIIFSKRGT